MQGMPSHSTLKQLVEMEYLHLCLDEIGIPEIKHITKNLELELVGQLKGLRVSVSDIRKIESRFLLLIGSDDNLLEAVGAYIYCLNCIKGGGTSLFYHSFRGKSEGCLDKVLTLEDTFRNTTAISQCEFFKEGGNAIVMLPVQAKRVFYLWRNKQGTTQVRSWFSEINRR